MDISSSDTARASLTVLQLQPLELQLMIIKCCSWRGAVLASATCRPWYALARLEHTWAVQWYKHFGSSIAGATQLGHSYGSFQVALLAQRRAEQGRIDMTGQWIGHGEQQGHHQLASKLRHRLCLLAAGYSYHLRLVLDTGEELWRAASSNTNCYLTYGRPLPPERLVEGYTSDFCAMMASGATVLKGLLSLTPRAGEYYTSGGPPLGLGVDSARAHLRQLPPDNLKIVSGYFEWYLDDTAPEGLGTLNMPGSMGREFVCGVLSDRTLQLMGTHVDEAGQSSVGQDVYQLTFSEDFMTMKGTHLL